MKQGEVAEDEFWEGLQSLGLGRDLSRSHVSRMVKSFKASDTEINYNFLSWRARE